MSAYTLIHVRNGVSESRDRSDTEDERPESEYDSVKEDPFDFAAP